ncbi:MAG: hypothetical protein GXO82_01815 [Chlorobi bacterium]|nr:hypothetical protein [Chlorobiota bacterium]
MDPLRRMHTAEHILTRVMKNDFGANRNVEMHLGAKKSKCDYDVKAPLTEDDVKTIEEKVNAVIREGLAVEAYVVRRDEAEDFDTWKVPPGQSEIRIVTIGDFDSCPCSGDHVDNTSRIGTFFISSFDLKPDGLVRIRFKLKDPNG